ncbi:MAG: hypothetical protein ACXVCH_03190 [Bdellovibrionota bacterium]
MIYGALSCVAFAWTSVSVFDERVYLNEGRYLLSQGDYSSRREEGHHPPFAKWWGISVARTLQLGEGTEPARIGSIVIFLAVMIPAALELAAEEGELAALLFAAMIFLSPFIKSIASLHLTDGIASVLGFGAVMVAWKYRRSMTPRAAGAIGFLLTLAIGSKLSVLQLVPFFVVYAGLSVRKDAWKVSALAVAGALLALLLVFRGHLAYLPSLADNLRVIAKHATDGHVSYLFGRQSTSGFWYYFLAMLALKPPLLVVLGWLAAIGLALRNPFRHSDALLYFLLPAATMIVIASASRIHIGHRHILLSILLLVGFAAIVLGRSLRTLDQKKIAAGALLIIVPLVVTDFWTLAFDDYLASFNWLAPRPLTREFADSVIDYDQGIPKHLRKRLPTETPRIDEIRWIDALNRSADHPISVLACATELAGLSSKTAPALRQFQPAKTIGACELHYLSAGTLQKSLQALTGAAPCAGDREQLVPVPIFNRPNGPRMSVQLPAGDYYWVAQIPADAVVIGTPAEINWHQKFGEFKTRGGSYEVALDVSPGDPQALVELTLLRRVCRP